jgi:hypothetical protein
VRVLKILRDHQLDPYHNPLDAHLFPDDRTLRIQFCKLLRRQCQVSYLPSSGKNKHTRTRTHTYHVKVLLMEFKTLYSEGSLSRLCILNRHFNPLSPELNSICYLLALLDHDFLHVSRIRVKSLTLR